MSNEKRFRALRLGDTVSVYGTLADTTTFEALDSLVESGDIMDLEQLEYVSWIGINNLLEWLIEHSPNYKLKRIPWHVYDMLRMLAEFDGSRIISIIVPTMSNITGRKFSHEFKTEYLQSLYKNKGLFPITEMGEIMTIPITHLCPNLFVKNQNDWTFPKGWFKENPGHTQFWLSYLGFVTSTVGVGFTLIQAAEINIKQMVESVARKISNCETALIAIDKKPSDEFVREANDITTEISEECSHIGKKLNEMRANFIDIQEMTARKITKGGDNDTIIECVVAMQEKMGTFPELATELEVAGETIGRKISRVNLVYEMKNDILAFEGPSKEQLIKIREAFYLMNPLSEDDWAESKLEIEKEFEALDNEVGRCIVTLQTFDLVRQILEHRLNEGSVIERHFEDLLTDKIQWQDIRKVLNLYIANSMVTDQEKLAFQFFLPKGFLEMAETDKAAPGDLMLF